MRLSCDVETACEVDLKRHGLDKYVRHPSFRILMMAWAIDDEPVQVWDCTDGSPMPARLRAALLDPDVLIHAFNATFERHAIEFGWGISIPAARFRCTMIRAYQQSFMGTLGQIGGYVGLPEHMQKDKEGDRLIRIFSVPQKVTKNQPYRWRDSMTDPEDWKRFLSYCVRDVVAEREILRRLDRYPSPAVEQHYYALTEAKNDAGIPIDRQFVTNGIAMAARRRAELTVELKALTGLANPNSPIQLTQWLVSRGYPFGDINKNTVKKVLAEHEEGLVPQTDEVVKALQLRRQVARTSPKKFDAILDRAHDDDLMRHAFQFCGASRTNRESGRGAQPHNFPRPPGWMEDEKWLDEVTETIRRGDYDWLSLLVEEPLDAIVGAVRSSFRAPAGYEWVVADLASIESSVFAYLSGDKALLEIARTGRDPYKSFASTWFGIPFDEVTKAQRTLSKPSCLGCQYRLGGGSLRDGKKTGLWGYAESMSITMTQKEAADAVRVWREAYPGGRQYWYDLEEAIMETIQTGAVTRVGCMTFDLQKPYLRAQLPTGRYMYYHLPRVSIEHGTWPDGSPYSKPTISYMGKNQNTGRWERLYSHGGKFAENCFSAQTKILTPCGPKDIVDLTTDDEVWDGEEWVQHSGVAFSGHQRTVDFGGVRVTADHLVDVEGRWVKVVNTTYQRAVASFHGYYRAPFWSAHRTEVPRQRREEDTLVDALRLRNGAIGDGVGSPAGTSSELRVHEARMDSAGDPQSRHVETSSVRSLAVNERPVQAALASGLAQLRWAWNNGFCRVAGVVRDVLAGYGTDIFSRCRLRPQRQQSWVLERELPLGFSSHQLPQQAAEHRDRNAGRPDVDLRGSREVRHQRHDADVSSPQRLSAGADVRQTGLYEPVYDVTNAGPNSRFTVVGPDGSLFLAHNCTQALAREVLYIGAARAHAAGFDIRLKVHDEIGTLRKVGDERYSVARLEQLMTDPIDSLPGLPLRAEGWVGPYYRK